MQVAQDKEQVLQPVHSVAAVPAAPVPGGQCQGRGEHWLAQVQAQGES